MPYTLLLSARYAITFSNIPNGITPIPWKNVNGEFHSDAFLRRLRLSNAEIATLIGDRTGPAIIALPYGDVLRARLFAQAKWVRLLVWKSDI